jgi:cysteine-rich repeat protein
MLPDFPFGTAAGGTSRKRLFRLVVILCVVGGVFLVILTKRQQSNTGLPDAIPVPFDSATDGRDRRGSNNSSPLRGALTELGRTPDSRKIVDMTFEDKDSELFGLNDLTFVLTPSGAGPISAGAPLSVALTAGKAYGYKYTSADASLEIAMLALKNDPDNSIAYDYSQVFPGEFFAADSSLNDLASAPSMFLAQHPDVVFKSLSDITLEPDARYLIIAEEQGLTITVRGLMWCGDRIPLNTSGEVCDDGNKSNADGCTNSCQNARCGDTFTQQGVEQCDDGNAEENDFCGNSCMCDHEAKMLELGDLNGDKVIGEAEADSLLLTMEQWLDADVPDPELMADANCDGTKNDDDATLLISLLSLILQ